MIPFIIKVLDDVADTMVDGAGEGGLEASFVSFVAMFADNSPF